jgi:hypothetical protein
MGQGKEAVTVRHAILVIVLIASSFLGGAFVNGPGLRWAQTRLMRSLGLNEDGEIASVDLMAAATPDGLGSGSGVATSAGEPMLEPLAAAPSVVADDEPSQHVPSDHHTASSTKLNEKPRHGSSSKTQPVSPSPSSSQVPVPVATGSGSQQSASPDSEVKPAGGGVLDGPGSSVSKVKPALLDSLGTLLLPSTSSAPESPSGPVLSSSAPVSKSIRNVSDDWIVLQQKLQALNVSRFTIEGEPGGRILFSCLIPLAGRQAVTQRFEADGDDVVQAMQATLRRIALWRATQPQMR